MSSQATIFAVSSGAPPAGIAIVRISGPAASSSFNTLSDRPLPTMRLATLVTLSTPEHGILDQAIVVYFPGPASATGEDIVELHLHGGRAVVAAVLSALAGCAGLRPAEPGEFTRRAFENGRIDFAQAEGLGDLLQAETEAQRRNAIAQTSGGLSQMVAHWDGQLTEIAAQVEALIDFSDEDDVVTASRENVNGLIDRIARDIADRLQDPPAERLRDGLRVAIIGPPNAGKSTLLNRLVSRDAAIVSPIAGTTRDLIEIPVMLGGLPLVFIDTAGLRTTPSDEIEVIGIARAQDALATADIILALAPLAIPSGIAKTILIHAKCDSVPYNGAGLAISAVTGAGMAELIDEIVAVGKQCLPLPDRIALNSRHRSVLAAASVALADAVSATDELLIAENLRRARAEIGRIVGRDNTESMLDVLFGTFCIGK